MLSSILPSWPEVRASVGSRGRAWACANAVDEQGERAEPVLSGDRGERGNSPAQCCQDEEQVLGGEVPAEV
jgi:hypothetical protein